AFSTVSAAFFSSRATRFSCTRSTPARTWSRAASRARRASLSETSLKDPSPCHRCLPLNRSFTGNDQIKTITIGVLAGLLFALNVEWFEFASHCVSPVETILRTHGQKLRFAF